MRRLPILISHRPGCTDFPLPVLHGRDSLAEVQMTTIRDLPAKNDAREDVRLRFHSCQFSYPLSFRGQVCEAWPAGTSQDATKAAIRRIAMGSARSGA